MESPPTAYPAEPLGQPANDSPWSAEHPARSFFYRLMARLCTAPPTMKDLANLDTIDTTLPLPEALSQRLSELSRGLLTSSPEALDKEYHDLFVGSCRGELLPYASWYCCGGLLGPPLLEIRKELSSFGIERKPGASEPEDHAAALLETMAILLEEDRVEPGRQGKFFLDHIDPWIHRFLDDLRHAPSSSFYRLVAALGSEFLAAERRIMQAG